MKCLEKEGIRICPQCGYQIEDSKKFRCPRCHKLLIKKCSECKKCKLF